MMMTIARVAADVATSNQYEASDAFRSRTSAPRWKSIVAADSKLNRDVMAAALLVPVLLFGSLLTQWAWAQATNVELTVRFNVMAAVFSLLFAVTIPSALLYLQRVLRPDGPALAMCIGLMTTFVAVLPFASDIIRGVPNIGLALALGVEVIAASVALYYVRVAMTDDEKLAPSDLDFMDEKRNLGRF